MIPTIKIVCMIVFPLVALALLGIAYYKIHKRSSKLESGLPGALGYGFLGYLWQYLIFSFLAMYFVALVVKNAAGFTKIGASFGLTFLSTAFTIAALYWGIYLTNEKKRSIYRSAVVGIGFSLGKVAIDLVMTYFYSAYASIRINSGQVGTETDYVKSVQSTTIFSMLEGTYKCILMFIVIMAVTLIMAKYYEERKVHHAWITGAIIYEITILMNQLTNLIQSGTFQKIIELLVLTIMAAICGTIVWHWFKTDEIEPDPRKILNL
ncbi:MAG: hypothetical protein J6B84_01310 [Eubacterium sp.]|nr:hypothetical protein [Eubacterium sp.]